MSGRTFFDTNVLVYSFCSNDTRSETAQELLTAGGVTGVQVLNEFVSVARRKLAMKWEEIYDALQAIEIFCPSPVPLTLEMHKAAVRIAERYGYSIFDSLIVAAALDGECGTLFSEDMRDGQRIEGLTIRNPFRA